MRRLPEWIKVFEIVLVFLVIPTCFFYILAELTPVFLKFGYYFVISLFVFQSALSVVYTTSAFARKKFRERPTAGHRPVPRVSFVVSAYLPNEIDVIEGTLVHILEKIERPAAGLEVILAYNTPHMEGIEPRLRELAYRWPELILANAHGSGSKTENLNNVLDLVSGEMVVLLDADHRVAPDCLGRAWRWLDEGYGVVQGRCRIRNGKVSLVASLVEVEFEAIYGISHYAKSRLFDSALFGGTNGYWKASVLKEVRFQKDRLTEDIDATMRAVLRGVRIVHDRSIISTELAPQTLSALWHQRKRWAQGWFQCSVEHQAAVWVSRHLNVLQKFMWTTLLMWRIAFDILGHYLFPLVFAHWLHRERVEFPMDGYVWFSVCLTLLSGPYETIAAFKNAVRPRASVFSFLRYALLIFPYTLFKNTIQVVAIYDELFGSREWRVTSRGKG